MMTVWSLGLIGTTTNRPLIGIKCIHKGLIVHQGNVEHDVTTRPVRVHEYQYHCSRLVKMVQLFGAFVGFELVAC